MCSRRKVRRNIDDMANDCLKRFELDMNTDKLSQPTPPKNGIFRSETLANWDDKNQTNNDLGLDFSSNSQNTHIIDSNQVSYLEQSSENFLSIDENSNLLLLSSIDQEITHKWFNIYPKNKVTCMVYSPSSKELFIGSSSGHLRQYNVLKQTSKTWGQLHESSITGLV